MAAMRRRIGLVQRLKLSRLPTDALPGTGHSVVTPWDGRPPTVIDPKRPLVSGSFGESEALAARDCSRA